MKKIELLRKLEKYPVFGLKEVSNAIGKECSYAKLALYRMKKEGLVFEIERNKYALIKEPMIIASRMLWPCYLSCWTALRFHSLTEQLPTAIYALTTKQRRKKEIAIGETKIIFIVISPKNFFGFQKERHGNYDIFVADREKALIDSAMLKKVSFSELAEIFLRSMQEIDAEKMAGYLLRIKNKALIKRFGFLLEKAGIASEKLKKAIDSKYVPLDYTIAAKGIKNKRWKVIENVRI